MPNVVTAGSSRWIVRAAILLTWLASPLLGQEAAAARRPAVLNVQTATPPRVTLDLRDAPLRDVLRAIAAQGHVSLVYASDALPLDRRVSLRVTDALARDALRLALRDTGIALRETRDGEFVLVMTDGGRGSAAANPRTARPLASLGGRVTDSVTHDPVVNATVRLDDGAHRTLTDLEGRYHLAGLAPGAHAVTVRRIGYAPTTRAVTLAADSAATLDILLVPVASPLEAVVTTATGPQRRLEIGNAIGTIAADSVVRDAPVTTLADLVAARVPGAQVVLNAGLTGIAPRVRIRGINSLTIGNDPLLVVDGIRVENSSGSIGTYGHTSGRFNDLNPEEIESIEIVKGPSAATLYGTDAANGVILVRTKRGRPGRTRWQLTGETGTITPAAPIPDNYYAWGRSAATGAGQQCVLTELAAGACARDSLTAFNPLRDRATSPLGIGHRDQLGLQGSGGVAQFTYFVAGEYEQETGYLRMPGIDRARIARERGGAAIPDEQLRPNALRRVNLRANAGVALGPRADLDLAMGIVSVASRIPGNGIFQ
ncbi:MAG: TonB-dependent receptor plug domain-containing protein, partial [Gemmatimonadaceae bacterium]|nr:TonB-dependent receptor plug domain-containing protein [Gemmatimonadaceae bacterium]